jgi:hypothetical protein
MHSKKHLKLVHSASLRPEDWLRFVHLDPFPGQWSRLKLGETELQALEVCIMSAPLLGRVVPGTGGLRKARFSTSDEGKGKSGSYRVFYVYYEEYGTVILWAIIDKGEKADLTKAQCNAIGQQIARLKRLLDQGVIK